MRVFFTLFIIIIYSTAVSAQDKKKEYSKFNPRISLPYVVDTVDYKASQKHSISVFIGTYPMSDLYSTEKNSWELIDNPNAPTAEGSNLLKQTPHYSAVFDIRYDYRLNRTFSVEAQFGYYNTTIDISPSYRDKVIYSNYRDSFFTNISVKTYLINALRYSFYIAIGGGALYTNTLNRSNTYNIYSESQLTLLPYFVYGCKFKLTPQVSAVAEFGIGASGIAKLGIAYTFKQKIR